MKRVITAVLALGLLTFAPLALTSPASAGEVVPQAVEQEAAAEGPQQEAKRKVSLFLKENRRNRFTGVGQAKPNYKNSQVIIKRAIGENSNNYKIFKKVRTNRAGKYRVSLANPPRVGQTFKYFALVKKRGNYSAARSSVRGITRIS